MSDSSNLTRKLSIEVAPTARDVSLPTLFFGWLLVIYNFKFSSAFQPQSAIPLVTELLLSSHDGEL